MKEIEKSTVLHHYDEHHLPTSASIIVPMVMDIYAGKTKHAIHSVIDVGCGLGQWLYTFKMGGVNTILGIDGSHVLSENLYIEKDEFLPYDLNRCGDLKIGQKYDLAISLEVAEHLPEDVADDYVSLLVRSSDVILFSAAIPNQTGENHINEQPHQYWANKFALHNYFMLDIFRPRIWDNSIINWWYRQNMFLCVKKDSPLFDDKFLFDGRTLVHPELLLMYVNSLSSITPSIPSSNHFTSPKSRVKKIILSLKSCVCCLLRKLC